MSIMINFRIFTIFAILVVVVRSDEMSMEDKKKIREICKKEIDYKEGNKTGTELYEKNLCLFKCYNEKSGAFKDGKIVMDEMKKYALFSVINREEYLKCMAAIDHIKECKDMTKYAKCEQEFGATYFESCGKKNKLDMKKVHEEQKKSKILIEYLCTEKCILEMKGILDEDGKIVQAKIKTDDFLILGIKYQEKFEKCLGDVVIKDCSDMMKVFQCKKDVKSE